MYSEMTREVSLKYRIPLIRDGSIAQLINATCIFLLTSEVYLQIGTWSFGTTKKRERSG
jgi:hypothetical protein